MKFFKCNQDNTIFALMKSSEPSTTCAHAEFLMTDADEVIAAYEYCNIHGLWKAEV